MKGTLTRTAALGGVLVAWAAVAYGNQRLELMPPAVLPTPGAVVAVFGEMVRDGSLGHHLVTSLLRVIQGFGLAAAAALGLGVLAGICLPLRHLLDPAIEFVRPIPPLAFLPMFLVWFGLGETSKVAFIGYTTFFPMFVAIGASVLRVDVTLLRAAGSLGATRRDLIRRVVLPAALPGIVVALRLGCGSGPLRHRRGGVHGSRRRPRPPHHGGSDFFNPAQIVMGALVLGLLGSSSTPSCSRSSGACCKGAPPPDDFQRRSPCAC